MTFFHGDPALLAYSSVSCRRLFSFPESVNLHGGRLTAFLATVSEGDRAAHGGGGVDSEGELVDLVELPATREGVVAFLRDYNGGGLEVSADAQLALTMALGGLVGGLSLQ